MSPFNEFACFFLICYGPRGCMRLILTINTSLRCAVCSRRYIVASDCLELAATFLASADNVHMLKLVIQCFCNIYPLLFRLM